MNFLARLILKIILNGVALWLAERYVPGFALAGGTQSLVLDALVLALLNFFVRPVLRLLTTPLRWLTLGLFNIVINIAILWLAQKLVPQLIIHDFLALLWTSLIVGFMNAVF